MPFEHRLGYTYRAGGGEARSASGNRRDDKARERSAEYEKSFFWRPSIRQLVVSEHVTGPALSDTSSHPDRALWRRWPARYIDTNCERANARLTRPTDSDRQRNGRIRRHRRWPRRSSRA